MIWSTQTKEIPVTNQTGHYCPKSGVYGRNSGIREFQFRPSELYGAAARTSHMHFVDPDISTPESRMIGSILERHVDDHSTDFALLPSANNFKDFVKSFFTGTVASGTAYLSMIRDGYRWCAHFENVATSSTKGRTPDFFFAADGRGVALAESKGTRSKGRAAFDSYLEAEYLGQVEPHLGKRIGELFPTHGFCLGTWLTSPSRAEMMIHHTQPLHVDDGAGRDVRQDGLGRIQRENYAVVFALAAGPSLGAEIRNGKLKDAPSFIRFEWRGRNWLTRQAVLLGAARFIHPIRLDGAQSPLFAIEENIAGAVLNHVEREGAMDYADYMELPTLPEELMIDLSASEFGDPGAIFPDGLALVRESPGPVRGKLVHWYDGSFETLRS